MADEPTEAELRDARLIVAAAIAAVGPAPSSSVAWKARVNSMIPPVGAMFGAKSHQVQRALAMLGATVFWTEFIGFTDEYTTHDGKRDQSNRLQVALKHNVDKRHPDGIQYIRTERLDTPSGKMMKDRLAQIESGDEVICWKVQEEMRSGGGETMAVLYQIEPTGRRNAGAKALDPPASAPASAPEDVVPPSSSGANVEMDAFNKATEDWDGKTKAALVRDLKFADLFPPTTENVDRMITFIKEWSF